MTEMSGILIFLVIFLLGGVIGFALCRITLGTKQIAAQQQELDDTRAELEQYKSQVKNHFTNSAELMKQVASSYQALYSHMAGQSQTLLSDTDLLPFAQLKMPSEKGEEAAEVEEVKQEMTKESEPQVQETTEKPSTDVKEETSETKLEAGKKESSKQSDSNN